MSANRYLGFLVLAVAGWLLPNPAPGQTGKSAPSPPASGGNPGRGTPAPTTTPPPTTNTTQPNSNPAPRPIINLTGQVLMDDGSEVPQNTAIERVCMGSPHIEGHTDSKGYFSIQLGGLNVDTVQDASTSSFSDFGAVGAANGGANGLSNAGGFNVRELENCELRARAPGYESQSIQLGLRHAMDNPDVGTILLHRLAGSEGTTVSASSLAAPKNAKKALQKGSEFEKKHKVDEARASFQQAVDAYPKYSEAWYALGRAQVAQSQTELARKSFTEAIRADSKFVPPYIQVSILEFQAERWKELVEVSNQAIQLDTFNYPEAFFMNAVANYSLKHVELAEQSARHAQKLDTQHRIPQVSHLLGMILAGRHEYAAAAGQLREYLRYSPQAKDAASVQSLAEQFDKESTRAAATNAKDSAADAPGTH
jgi:tetratricopeptide (TPR) repeat protein